MSSHCLHGCERSNEAEQLLKKSHQDLKSPQLYGMLCESRKLKAPDTANKKFRIEFQYLMGGSLDRNKKGVLLKKDTGESK